NRPLPMKVARNVLGAGLIGAGVAMLVLPGQGILTILIGVSIIDLPLKRRVLRRLLQQPKIQEGVQRLRSKAGKPPLVFPEQTHYSDDRLNCTSIRAARWASG